MTNVERRKRGMIACDICPRCNSGPESIMHLLRDCQDVKDWWSNIIDLEHWSKFFTCGLHSWLDWNLSCNKVGGHSFH